MIFFSEDFVDWSGRQRLQREQRELKAPQERSDEEIEAVPAESVRLQRKSQRPLIQLTTTQFPYYVRYHISNKNPQAKRLKEIVYNQLYRKLA